MNFDQLRVALQDNNRPIPDGFSFFLDKVSLVVNNKDNDAFFSNFHLPSSQDINLIEHLYNSLMPFIVESVSEQHDIYCYEFEQEAYPKVVVFSDHALVNKWDSVSEFLSWLAIRVAITNSNQ